MKTVLRKEINNAQERKVIGESLWFFCPGCKDVHRVYVNTAPQGAPVWKWNGETERPTLQPSILTGSVNFTERRCHSFVEDGKIRFLDDCHHELKGMTVELPDVPEWLERN